MSRPILVLLLCLMTTLAANACRGKGHDAVAAITSVSPTGSVGATSQEIEFSAIVEGATEYSLSWDFGDGADPTTSTELEPLVTLQAADTYAANVRLLIDDVVIMTFPFEYTVTGAPVILAVTPDGTVGLPAAEVAFSAIATNSPTSWLWTFPEGSVPETSTDASPVVALPGAGTWSGTVIATNAAGSAVFPFEFDVAAPQVPTWTKHDIAPVNVNRSLAVAANEGRLAIAYNGVEGGVGIAMAKVAQPCCPADWDVYELDPIGVLQGGQTLIARNGRLILTYAARADEFSDSFRRVAVSENEHPTSSADWNIFNLSIGPFDSSGAAMMTAANGDLLLVYTNAPTGIAFARCTAEIPAVTGDFTIHNPLSPEETNLGVGSVALAEGPESIWIVYTGPWSPATDILWQVHSSTLDPESDEDWTKGLVDAGTGTATRSPFVALGETGVPLLLYPRNTPIAFQTELVAREANSTEPLDSLEWTDHLVATLNESISGISSGSAANRFWMSVSDQTNQQLRLWRQISASAVDPADWTNTVVDPSDQAGGVGRVVLFEARLVFVYTAKVTGNLRVAFGDTEF